MLLASWVQYRNFHHMPLRKDCALRYKGECRNGKPHGTGVMHYPHPPLNEYYAGLKLYDGCFSHGVECGPGYYEHRNGHIERVDAA